MSQVTVMNLSPQEVQVMISAAVRAARPVENPHKKRLLTGKDVEKEYGICDRTLERWRAEGVGPMYTSIGRRIFYEREVLDAFIADGRVKTKAL